MQLVSTNPNHVLCSLLPDKRDQRYYLTARRNDRQFVKSNRLLSNDCNSPITQSNDVTAIARLSNSTADLRRHTVHVIIYAIPSNGSYGSIFQRFDMPKVRYSKSYLTLTLTLPTLLTIK